MFAESVRISCCFLASRGALAKYQTCLIFYHVSQTFDPYHGSAHLVTVQSCLSMACLGHFPSCPILLQSCLEAQCGHNQPYLKVKWLVLNNPDLTGSLPVKTGLLQVLGCRVSNITAGQKRKLTKWVTTTDKSGIV